MQDEGIGVRALEWLQAHYELPEVEMIDGGTMGLDLLHYLEGVDHLIILDAIEAGQVPGQVLKLIGDDLSGFLNLTQVAT